MVAPKQVASERALRLKRLAKEKKPKFVRQESWKYIRLKENWRRPRGLDNKVRKRIKGWPPRVSAGYGGPKNVRGLHPSGLEDVLVYNVEDIRKINLRTQAARIAHTVGRRKRTQILTEARKKRIEVLNLRHVREPAEEKEPTEEVEEKVETEVDTEKTLNVEEQKKVRKGKKGTGSK